MKECAKCDKNISEEGCMKMNESKRIDSDALGKLLSYMENSHFLYEFVYWPLIRQFKGQIRKGKFDMESALSTIKKSYISRLVEKYHRDVDKSLHISKATEDKLAKRIMGLMITER